MDSIGKYEIIEKIGSGGFGEVFKGFDPFIKRHVAIKTCRTGDEEIRTRFFQEAEIAGNLHHRNITTVYDFGLHDELPYLIQEYLSGEDLDLKIKRRDSIPFAEKLYYLLQIARGLEHAHRKGVVHRDVKPSNIRVLEDGSTKIMDFGIAKLAQRESSLTQTGMTLGTAAYLSPEQIRGDAVDQRTDLFSFGVLSYELLSYERPFKGEQISAVLYQILHGEAPELEDPGAEVPAEMVQLIRRCLKKDQVERYRDAGDLLRHLEGVQKGRPAQAPAEALAGEQGPGRDTDPSGLSRTIAIDDLTPVPTSFAEEVTPAKPLPTQPIPPREQEAHDRLDLVELQGKERPDTDEAPLPAYQESIVAAPKRRSPWLYLLPLLLALIAGGWWLSQNSADLLDLIAGQGAGGGPDATEARAGGPETASEPEAGAPADPAAVGSREDPSSQDAREASDGSSDEVAGGANAPGPTTPTTTENPSEDDGNEVTQNDATELAAEPEPPPEPALLRIAAAPWAEKMTVRVGRQGRIYDLSRSVEVSLQPELYTLSFSLQHYGYGEESSLKVRLEAAEDRLLQPPIGEPAHLSIRARPGRPQGEVSINGQARGTSPLNNLFLKAGSYLVEISPIQQQPAGDQETDPAPDTEPLSSLVKNLTLEPGLESILTFDLVAGAEPVVRVKGRPTP